MCFKVVNVFYIKIHVDVYSYDTKQFSTRTAIL